MLNQLYDIYDIYTINSFLIITKKLNIISNNDFTINIIQFIITI